MKKKKQILIMLMDSNQTFEAHGERFALVDVPEHVEGEQLNLAFGDVVFDAESHMRELV